MSTPYTTKSGLRIGSKCDANVRHEYHDRDALRLQAALLGNRPQIDWDGIVIVLGTLAAIGAVFWVTA